VFAGGKRIAAVASTGTPLYYETDHLSSTRAVTSAGASPANAFYEPYGAAISDTTTVRHKFTGQEFDGEIALYNYGARLYDPSIGRFMSPDSAIPGASPQALNRYAYGFNNPIAYMDPSGHTPWFAAAIIGAVVGAVVGGTEAALTGSNILKGVGMGAATGAITGLTMGAATAVVGTAQAGTAFGSIAYGYAGAVSGSINASIQGANPLQGALVGAGAGAAMPYVDGLRTWSPFGSSQTAGGFNYVAKSVATQSALGGVDAAIGGRNLLSGVEAGAVGGFAGGVFNLGAGRLAGALFGDRPASWDPTYNLRTVTRDNGVGGDPAGGITIGDTTIVGPKFNVGENNQVCFGSVCNVGTHEGMHMVQSFGVGAAYLPVEGLFMLFGMGLHMPFGLNANDAAHTSPFEQ